MELKEFVEKYAEIADCIVQIIARTLDENNSKPRFEYWYVSADARFIVIKYSAVHTYRMDRSLAIPIRILEKGLEEVVSWYKRGKKKKEREKRERAEQLRQLQLDYAERKDKEEYARLKQKYEPNTVPSSR